jgi:hypothetical protein
MSSRISPTKFEQRVKRYFENLLHVKLEPKGLKVGPNMFHTFDLVSEDQQIVIECKSYTWTKAESFPSAKISTANEALFLLSRIKAKQKILVMQDHYAHGKSLVETYVRRYEGLMDDVEIWRFIAGDAPIDDKAQKIRDASQIWYKTLYQSGETH